MCVCWYKNGLSGVYIYASYIYKHQQQNVDDNVLLFHYNSKCNFRVPKLRLIQSKSMSFTEKLACLLSFNVIIEFSEFIFSIIQHKAP